ncbi:hypothetical protein [Bilophila wadsworthia]
MKYVPPLGATDPNASYQDGNPEAGILGSIVPAAAIERPQREILNVLTAAGLTPSDTDLTQLLAAIRKIIGTQNAELERLRLLKIGCPMYWRSTTLPEGFAWVNGDLVLFEDRPEFEEVYLAGGFEGMLLEANATSGQIAANLGKFRKHPNGLGLYLPSCGEQFFRGWTLGAGEAGVNVVDTGRTLTASWTTGWAQSFIPTVYTGGAVYAETSTATQASVTATDPVIQPFHVVFDAARVWGEHAATEFSPAHVRLPVILYLGLSTWIGRPRYKITGRLTDAGITVADEP